MDPLTNIPDDFEDIEKYAPTLFSIGRYNCFTVPENYFATSADLFTTALKIQNYKTRNDFALPDDYFEQLPERILAQSKILTLPVGPTFTQPPKDYFDKLPEEIRIKTKHLSYTAKKQLPFGKIIQLHYRKIAIAASLLLVVGLGSLFFKYKHPPITSYKTIASASEIQAFLESSVDETTLVEYVSDKGIPESVITAEDKEIINYVLENSEEYKNEIIEL